MILLMGLGMGMVASTLAVVFLLAERHRTQPALVAYVGRHRAADRVPLAEMCDPWLIPEGLCTTHALDLDPTRFDLLANGVG